MIDKKDSNPTPGVEPASAPDDENPWDDDGGGRTLAQDSPSFELPSNIPSPITVPPPAPAVPPAPVPFISPAPPAVAAAPAAPAAPAPPAPPGPAAPPAPLPRPGAHPPKPRAATMMGFGPPGPPLPGQTGPGLPMGGGMGFTPAGGVPVTKPASAGGPAAAPAPPRAGSSPGLSGTGPGGPPSSNRRPPPLPPRPLGGAAPISAKGAPAAPAAAAPAAPAAPVISSNPPPDPGADGEDWPNASQQEDGPTMAVASPALANRPLRDDVVNPRPGAAAPTPAAGRARAASPLASTGYSPGPTVDKDAETMALGGDDPRLPSLDGENEVEETTRAVSREELIRHQDASFVVGNDAMGDEATLAVAPGQVDLGLPGSGLAAALAESIKRESQPNLPAPPPAFPVPPPPHAFQNNAPTGSSGHLPASLPQGAHPGMQQQQQQQQPWGASGDQAAPWGGDQGAPWQGGPQSNPLGPQSQPYPGYPQSGPHAAMQPYAPQGYGAQGGTPGFGPNANTAQRPGAIPGGPGQPGGAPSWMMQPTGGSLQSKLTPQVILLVAVGAVCLAIFIIGIVLFVTTKFS